MLLLCILLHLFAQQKSFQNTKCQLQGYQRVRNELLTVFISFSCYFPHSTVHYIQFNELNLKLSFYTIMVVEKCLKISLLFNTRQCFFFQEANFLKILQGFKIPRQIQSKISQSARICKKPTKFPIQEIFQRSNFQGNFLLDNQYEISRWCY